MSVLTHLDSLGRNLILTSNEDSSITRSISTLKTRLKNYFDNITQYFVFGSYDRSTILPRSVDSNSDIDFMIVFKDGENYKPQTLISRLKKFVDTYYSTSEVYQSSPTMVLNLNHIKFELVPAYLSCFGTLYIPGPASGYIDWISTNPNQMKTDLINNNTSNNYKIKPLVRILKYWNVRNGKVYSSYDLESYVIGKSFFHETSLKDYFFSAAYGLPTFLLPVYKSIKVVRLQTNLREVQRLLDASLPVSAENKLKEVLPGLL